MSLRDELQAIYDRNGKLTPEVVVQEARDKKHPLHDRFEWDDKKAGEAWRREQAHQLIRSVRIVYQEADDSGPEKSVRAFHAVRSDAGFVYEPAEKVVADPILTEIVMRDMKREWLQLQRRYGDFQEFWQLVASAVDQAA